MKYLVFTTPTCPNCPRVKSYMESVEMQGDLVDASTPEGLDLARKYEVTSVPTVIFLNNDEEVKRVNSKEDAEKFISENS